MDEINSATGAGLLEFIAWTLDKGELKPATASSLRTASINVLSIEDNATSMDLRSADVEDVLRRFENKCRHKYNEKSLEAYKRRFAKSVRMYLAWLDGRDWRPVTRDRQPAKSEPRTESGASPSKSPQPHRPADPAARVGATESTRPSGASQVEYPFPIRPGVRARVWLPDDLTSAEAERLTGFIKALVVQDERRATNTERSGESTEDV